MQATFAEHLEKVLGWDSVYAWNQETFGSDGTLGRADTREAVLKRDLRAALIKFNPPLPAKALDEAISALTHYNFSRSLIEHNQAFHRLIRDGVPVSYHDAKGDLRHAQAQVIDFRNPANNRFLAVRELKLTGLCAPGYNRRDNLDGQIYRTFACWKNCWARITKSSPPMISWITQTQAEVEVFILDRLYSLLSSPTFSDADKEETARKVYNFIWQQGASGQLGAR